MTIAETATRKAMDYVRSGMDAKDAVRRACLETVQENAGMGDFAESWDTLTSWLPWILAGVAGIAIYRTGVKVHRATSDYISQKKRKYAAAKAAWDAVI